MVTASVHWGELNGGPFAAKPRTPGGHLTGLLSEALAYLSDAVTFENIKTLLGCIRLEAIATSNKGHRY